MDSELDLDRRNKYDTKRAQKKKSKTLRNDICTERLQELYRTYRQRRSKGASKRTWILLMPPPCSIPKKSLGCDVAVLLLYFYNFNSNLPLVLVPLLYW